MKRLKQNLPDTTPFVNSDFYDILQNQHQLAYSAWIESINDVSLTSSLNTGIILRGCEITYTEPVGFNTTTYKYSFNYKMKFTESDLVYINGQYYSPVDNLINQTVQVNNASSFYLVPLTFSSQDTEISKERVRLFRDKTYGTFSVDYRFDLVKGDFPGTSSNIQYVGFEWGGTSRRLKRLLNLNRAATGDVMIKRNSPVWYHFGPSLTNPFAQFGYGATYTGTIFRDFDTNGVGRNEMKGFRLYSELSGRFMVGLSSSSPTSPASASYFEINYGQVGNIGGYNALTFSKNQIPAHDHTKNDVYQARNQGNLYVVHTNFADPESLEHSHRLDRLTNYSGRFRGGDFNGIPSKGTSLGYRPGQLNNKGGVEPNSNNNIPDPNRLPVSTGASSDLNVLMSDYFFGGFYRQEDASGVYLKNVYSTQYSQAFGGEMPYNDAYTSYKLNYENFNYLAAGPGYKYLADIPDSFAWRTQFGSYFRPNYNLFEQIHMNVREKGDIGAPSSTINWTNTLIAHTHQISDAGGNLPHENRPPYLVVLYYTKI